ncbi:MAG: NAD-dependent epimerase/dehydratase family protein [Candidatus Omnitrophica bacterium]|nr:NAD-dependent epimerase/dehydratase family protein [Candidatus Omnitrophota bacterium]
MIKNYFNKKKILIVGGAGFVGSNLARYILQDNELVTILIIDNLLSSERINIPDDHRVFFIEGSITDDRILKHIYDDFSYIFHLATYHGNQSSIHDPIRDHENNTLTTLKLLNHIKDFRNLEKFIYSSAGCSVAEKTFDNARPTTEDDPINLNQDSPYSISKIIGEFYCVYFHKQHNVPTVRARFQNVYGPWEILGAGQWRGTPATVWRNVIPTFIYKALKNKPIPIENNGIATRDFIYVDDICKGLILCALKGKNGDVYNFGTNIETSIKDLAEIILKLTKSKSTVEYLPKRPWDNSGKRFASIDKARKELGFEPKVSLSDGLKMTIEWTKKNIKIIEACISKHECFMKEFANERNI